MWLWGFVADEDIKKGEFVIEYVGESEFASSFLILEESVSVSFFSNIKCMKCSFRWKDLGIYWFYFSDDAVIDDQTCEKKALGYETSGGNKFLSL